ncbi:uncharacterized protein LOC127243013 [Andrographis paniculata]|uniref:uncharacterized protein LOC127243013 n=1 Tax=Andrographis paniculata TaxID=175694 RepID=UPI0021E79B9D|nr:uncharacterized protein LOC127243013 [Andrographis paniculata]
MASLTGELHSTEMQKGTAARGFEVFVGGLPRSITEGKIHEVFFPCGDILEIRMIKDPKGNLKGFCFVRFATKEAAVKAVTEKSGVMIDGKKIGVLPSSEQDTLYFGNLNKAWTVDDFERMVLQVFPDVESVDLAMLKDISSNQKHRNRGFAFVKFSSHAAAARALRVGSQPEFRLGNLHPSVQWAEHDPETDPREHAKVKIAFVRNLPVDADENYLKQFFEPFGKVEKVVVSKKSAHPVGFVHFSERSDLEKAVRELNEKKVRGPNGGQMLKLEVEIAKPMDKNKKRGRDNSESKSSVQSHSKHLKEGSGVALSRNEDSHLPRELEPADPYEDVVMSLPLGVKERLLHILRLGIANRYDLDVRNLQSLKELPEHISISILEQFMESGAALPDKGTYLSGLIARQVDRLRLDRNLGGGLPVPVDTTHSEARHYSFSRQVSPPPISSFSSRTHSTMPRPDNYMPSYSPPPLPLPDYPVPGRSLPARIDDKGSDYLLPHRPVHGSQSVSIPRMGMLDERSRSPYEPPLGASVSYGRTGLRTEERRLSPVLKAPAAPASYDRAVASHQTRRSQLRFDPFTGEPYKFDPFTGEPILPEHTLRRY